MTTAIGKTALIVYDNEDGCPIIVICSDNPADAEEYILSLAEERLYEEYVGDVYFYGVSYEEWIADANRCREEYNDRYDWRKPIKSSYAYMLDHAVTTINYRYTTVLC